MVEFILGLCMGIIISFTGAMMWGHRLSIKEDELNQQLIKDFQDKYMETEEQKFYKRYET